MPEPGERPGPSRPRVRKRAATAGPAAAKPPRAISRFIVMAILQAARAERLGLPEPSAYSWGLNRAIFFAAAKRGFQETPGGSGEAGVPRPEGSREPYRVGQDFAYRDRTQATVYFTIGDETQTEKEFERQIIARFGARENFERAWKEATEIVAAADDASIQFSRGFYDRVYRPRRDALRAKWTVMIGGRIEP